jgi:ABC-type antimicrobial peptide transport system permease subunit
MREAALLVALGVGAGVLCAWFIGRAIASLLFGITPGDWPSIAVAIAVLSIVAAAAAWIPARRAVRVDPLIALRSE